MLMSIFNKKFIRIPLQYLKKSIHCARNHKGKGKWILITLGFSK